MPVTSQEDGSTGFLFVPAHLLTESRLAKVIQHKSLIDPVRRSPSHAFNNMYVDNMTDLSYLCF